MSHPRRSPGSVRAVEPPRTAPRASGVERTFVPEELAILGPAIVVVPQAKVVPSTPAKELPASTS